MEDANGLKALFAIVFSVILDGEMVTFENSARISKIESSVFKRPEPFRLVIGYVQNPVLLQSSVSPDGLAILVCSHRSRGDPDDFEGYFL